MERELKETKRALEEVKREYDAKTREWRQACQSLTELQTELMRKSMHVGSLAFAVEGQVKEKSRWFSSLTLLTRKLDALKLQHLHLAAEASSASHALLADLDAITSAVHQQARLNLHLNTLLGQGANERKLLYNRVLELKGNIRVFCRSRPLNAEELAAGASPIIDFESAKDGELSVKSNGVPKKSFKFDAVFCPQSDQADVFRDTAPFATSVLDGYNVCVFAYGQTGTGKTFTMEGTEEARGVNFRILQELFRLINERHELYRYNISVSALEVYNEQIRDLLGSAGGSAKRLEVRKVSEGMHHVPGLTEARVSNMSEVWEVLQTGGNARAVGSTNANEHSSRSHCIYRVMVKGENLLNGECTTSKLWLVDLAGSERVAKTEVQGERLKETQNINRSLSALGDVISALATKSPHIPFRNSKLTHLLQDSLGCIHKLCRGSWRRRPGNPNQLFLHFIGGDSKTLMFVQISPNERDVSETICSLNFASRVRGVELGPAKRQLDSTEFLRYKQLSEKAKLDTKTKDLQIKKVEETIHGLEVKVKERDLKNKNLQDKVKELESQLLVERKLARQHVDTKIAEQQMKHQQEEQNGALIRPPLGNRPLASVKNLVDPSLTLAKHQLNSIQPLVEKECFKRQAAFHAMEEFVKYMDPTEKENNPEMAELVPRRSGRASICPVARRVVPAASAQRRNSLIPLPSAAQIPLQFLPLAPIPATELVDESEDNYLPKQTSCDSPRVARKVSGILRRSLQRKFQTKSPMQQKRGVNVGMDKVRVSIGRLAHRTRAVPKGGVQKQSQKDKERGWNIGTVGRPYP